MEAAGGSQADPGTQLLLSRLFERLHHDIPDIEWNDSVPPFHSSYDNYHVYGVQKPAKDLLKGQPSNRAARARREHAGTDTSDTDGEEAEPEPLQVVARVSVHVLRLEREFKLARRLWDETSDGKHFIRPLRLVRLPPRQPGDVQMVAMVAEAPGRNYLRDLVELGPNFYYVDLPTSPISPGPSVSDQTRTSLQAGRSFSKVPLKTFLDFAVGAVECCETLHHGSEIVHGELRGDAFHLNRETGVVRLINFGSGARSFENGLTSAGWSSLMSERGVEHKLQFIAPEQTGRLPAEPDSRTDIYSLGILFWTMLTGEPAFAGSTPLDIMQNVLGRRIPSLDSKRPDVPHALAACIQKMTQKNMDERYQSTSGLRWDLAEIKRLMTDGDNQGLDSFRLGTKDVSCFFNLPSAQIGRQKQRDALIAVIEKQAARAAQSGPVTKKGLLSISTSSSGLSANGQDPAVLDEVMSESTGSGDHDTPGRMQSTGTDPFTTDALKQTHQQASQESVMTITSSTDEGGSGANRHMNSMSSESRGSLTGDRSGFDTSSRSTGSHITGDSSLLRTAQKLKTKSHCEVISLSGSAGLGKSSLLQSIQVTARSHGYFASAKFDQVKRAPFEPILRVMSSLFRQIFSENDVSTPFHNNIRQFVAPAWEILHTYLELPPWLLSQTSIHQPIQGTPSQVNSTQSSSLKCGSTGNTATDWLRAGGSNKQSRFTNTFLDVLRLLAYQKLICFCLDDLQYADAESLNMLHSLVKAHVPVVLILTCRSEDALSSRGQALLARATRIELAPFSEEETTDYVCATLHRPPEYVLPLVAVIQEKTKGNPFFIREMLDTCFRKQCIFYSWKTSQWEFDLDKVFNEFSSPETRQFSSNDFIARKLQDLPDDSRALLCWASLLGNNFSFTLIKQVMVCDCAKAAPPESLPPFSNDPVLGLQGALTAFTIMSTDDEDRFRFSHDRYLQAANILCDQFSKDEMNYVIVTAMMRHDSYDNRNKPTKVLFDQARHICNAVEVIKNRVPARQPFRDLLYQAAETAREQGARSIALYYFQHALSLLSDAPWRDEPPDTQYQETLTLLTKASASYWYLGFFDEANVLLKEIMNNARDPTDKAPAFIIQSRMYAQRGDSYTAFVTLKSALADFGVEIKEATWADCDAEFQELAPILQRREPDYTAAEHGIADRELLTVGAVFVELISSAFWSDSLLFYNLSLKMLRVYLDRGLFPQIGLAYVHFATIAVGRFGMVDFGIDMGKVALRLFDCFGQDPYVIGRGCTLHSLFLGHLADYLPQQLPLLERGMEATVLAGDRILHLLNIGIIAAFRFWSAHDLSEIEAYITYQSEPFPYWPEDLRGGVFLMSVRQYARALQGKTETESAATIFDDESHSSTEYTNFVTTHASAPKRPLSIYNSYRLVTLCRFGYYDETLKLGESLMECTQGLWSMRYHYSNLFYLAIANLAKAREDSSKREAMLQRVRDYYKTIKKIAAHNDVNYASWLYLIEAGLAEHKSEFGEAILAFENAINHATVHAFTLDEALSYELYAEYLIRRGSTRPARSMVYDAVAAYRHISALGKAQQVNDRYEFLLHGTRSLATVDMGTQTIHIDTGNSSLKLAQNEAGMSAESTADRTQAWLLPGAIRPDNHPPHEGANNSMLKGGLSAVGLDMIDLASILESSQLLSSELNVDKLLSKLTKIIVESSGAEICGLVVNDDEVGWCTAAIAGPDGNITQDVGEPIERLTDPVARQITLYVLRFKEGLFLQQVLEDERFANVPALWRAQHPEGRSIIALPILHGDNTLLGSIYVEGPPNSFTERNVTVLRLLVNQISISIANALLFKKLEKISASNASMLDIQKQSLAQARESERKAKMAEAKAMEMVRLKEEAAKAKSMFLANVSHELRTPLNGVIGMSELLKASKLNSEQESFADSIRVCADTLLSVINDILDFSKLEAGKMQMFNVQLSLTETISEVVRALSYTNMERGLQTIEQLGLDKDLLVMGDPVRLHQIFMNLLSNAYKFTARGSVTVKAVVEREDQQSITVTCSVADTGIGISEEQSKKLFLPFSQADSSTARSYGGTGLGLSICKAIIENVMRGRIWLTSTPGVGTTVSFTLTFQKVAAVKGGTVPPAGRREADPMAIFSPTTEEEDDPGMKYINLSSVPRDQLKICIAEDNPINQRIAINFVKKLGFKCEAFSDGQQAVDALERASKEGEPFHLVLMDVQMPVLDGYHATREIRKHTDAVVREVLVIAMTASAIRGDREKCLEAGMNNYLAKPVRAHVLKQMLEGYLSQANKAIPRLQEESDRLAKEILDSAAKEQEVGSSAESITSQQETESSAPSVTSSMAEDVADEEGEPSSAETVVTTANSQPADIEKSVKTSVQRLETGNNNLPIRPKPTPHQKDTEETKEE